jgi:hypothetical protein
LRSPHLVEPVTIRFSLWSKLRGPLLLIFIILVAAGCQQGTPPQPPSEPQAQHDQVRLAEPPATETPTEIALIRGGRRVDVGTDPEEAFAIFRGNQAMGFTSERLPPGFARPYQAQIWQAAEEGFGVITYNGRVVAAMYQQDDVTQERVNHVVYEHRQAIRGLVPLVISGKKVTYWFWEMEGQRLMISAFQRPAGAVYLTMAMGDSRTLDGLGVSPGKAQQDQIEADAILGEQEQRANRNGESRG